MATNIANTSVKVGMDASGFKKGADGLKGYFADIGATAGKLVGVLGLAALTIGGIKKGIEASFGKVIAFEKTSAILEAIGKTAGDSKESIAGLIGTLSTITGRNDEAGKALGDTARKMMSIGFSAAETEKMVSSFYKVAKASPAEIGETYSTLEKLALNLDEFGFVSLKQYKAVAQLGIPIMEIMAAKLTEVRGVLVTADEVSHQLKQSQESGGRSGITTQEQLQVVASLGDSQLVQAQIDAIGGTFAGAMKKSKEEISLMFFEIGKAINAFFGGTKNYVAIFKTITAGVKLAREQVELLGEVFKNNSQWIEDFKNGVDILVVAFIRGFEVMGQQLMESKQLISGWFDAFTENIPAIENAIGGFFSSAATMASDFFSGVATGFAKWATYGSIPIEKITSASSFFSSIGDGWLKNAASIGGVLISSVSQGIDVIGNLFSMVRGGLVAVGSGFLNLLNKITGGLSGVIGSAVGSIAKFAGWIGAKFAEAYYNIFKGLLNFITMGFSNKVIDSITGIASAMTSTFTGVVTSVTSAISGSASAIGGFFTSATKPVEDTTGAIKGMATATDTGTTRVSYMQEIFKGFGEYMTDFSNNFQAIFKVWDVIVASFGDGVSNVTNIWEGMYEIIQTIKIAAQVGFLVIYELGVKAINGILKVFEDMAAFTTKWVDKFTYGLTRILEVLGIVNKGTAEAMGAVDQARGNVGYNLGRFDAASPSEARQNIQNQAEEERRHRIQMYNERKFGLDKDKPAGGEKPDFNRPGGAGGAGSQVAAPTLIAQGGAEEYKMIQERNNAALQDGSKEQIAILKEINEAQKALLAKNQPAPSMTVVPMIPR